MKGKIILVHSYVFEILILCGMPKNRTIKNGEISLNLAKEILEKSKITFKYLSDYNINDINFRNIYYINQMILQYDI